MTNLLSILFLCAGLLGQVKASELDQTSAYRGVVVKVAVNKKTPVQLIALKKKFKQAGSTAEKRAVLESLAQNGEVVSSVAHGSELDQGTSTSAWGYWGNNYVAWNALNYYSYYNSYNYYSYSYYNYNYYYSYSWYYRGYNYYWYY